MFGDAARAWKEARGERCRAKALWLRMQDNSPMARDEGPRPHGQERRQAGRLGAGCYYTAEIMRHHLAVNRAVCAVQVAAPSRGHRSKPRMPPQWSLVYELGCRGLEDFLRF